MNPTTVMPGLDPGISFQLAQDRRVEPGDDDLLLAVIPTTVMPGLDPGISFQLAQHRRVEPGDDDLLSAVSA